MQDSQIAELKGPGKVERRDIGRGTGWGNLNDKDREKALQEIGREFPSHYREVIEEYFRRLAAEEVGRQTLTGRSIRSGSPRVAAAPTYDPARARPVLSLSHGRLYLARNTSFVFAMFFSLVAGVACPAMAEVTATRLDGTTVVGELQEWDDKPGGDQFAIW